MALWCMCSSTQVGAHMPGIIVQLFTLRAHAALYVHIWSLCLRKGMHQWRSWPMQLKQDQSSLSTQQRS